MTWGADVASLALTEMMTRAQNWLPQTPRGVASTFAKAGAWGVSQKFANSLVAERGGSFVRLIGLNSRGAKRSAFGYLQNRSEAVKVRSIPDGAGP
jgi:hypothetical protein